MNLEILDSISELQLTQKDMKAAFELFSNAFTAAPLKETMLAVESRFETYQHTAHIIGDLLNKAVTQAAELDALAQTEWEAQKK